jgi:hypothetical protein
LSDECGRLRADVRGASSRWLCSDRTAGRRGCDPGQYLRCQGQRRAAGHRAGGRAATLQACRRCSGSGRMHGSAPGSGIAGTGTARRPGCWSGRLSQPAGTDRAGRRRTAAQRYRVSLLGTLRGRPCGARKRANCLRYGTARLRLPLHVLYRSEDSRSGAKPQAGRCRSGNSAADRAGHQRSHPARANCEQL